MVQEPRPGSLPAYRRGSRLVVRGGRGLEPVTSLLLKRASPRSRRLRRLLGSTQRGDGLYFFRSDSRRIWAAEPHQSCEPQSVLDLPSIGRFDTLEFS
jgi:hypothetical protein